MNTSDKNNTAEHDKSTEITHAQPDKLDFKSTCGVSANDDVNGDDDVGINTDEKIHKYMTITNKISKLLCKTNNVTSTLCICTLSTIETDIQIIDILNNMRKDGATIIVIGSNKQAYGNISHLLGQHLAVLGEKYTGGELPHTHAFTCVKKYYRRVGAKLDLSKSICIGNSLLCKAFASNIAVYFVQSNNLLNYQAPKLIFNDISISIRQNLITSVPSNQPSIDDILKQATDAVNMILIIGPRWAGKSTLGKLLQMQLKLRDLEYAFTSDVNQALNFIKDGKSVIHDGDYATKCNRKYFRSVVNCVIIRLMTDYPLRQMNRFMQLETNPNQKQQQIIDTWDSRYEIESEIIDYNFKLCSHVNIYKRYVV